MTLDLEVLLRDTIDFRSTMVPSTCRPLSKNLLGPLPSIFQPPLTSLRAPSYQRRTHHQSRKSHGYIDVYFECCSTKQDGLDVGSRHFRRRRTFSRTTFASSVASNHGKASERHYISSGPYESRSTHHILKFQRPSSAFQFSKPPILPELRLLQTTNHIHK